MNDPPPLDRAIADQFSRVETTLCLSKKVIVITEDQLELRAQDGIQKLSARNSWVAPLGIFITCLATILTADFKDFSWIRSGTIKGLWIAVTLGSAVWLLTSLARMKKFGRREFMESIRGAGMPYYSPATAITATVGEVSPKIEEVVEVAKDSLQCRQCGILLPFVTNVGQPVRCPNCGTVN